MGITVYPCYVDQFIYKANLGKGMREHKLDHLFMCEYNGSSIQPNPHEVCETKWMSIAGLRKDHDQYAV